MVENPPAAESWFTSPIQSPNTFITKTPNQCLTPIMVLKMLAIPESALALPDDTSPTLVFFVASALPLLAFTLTLFVIVPADCWLAFVVVGLLTLIWLFELAPVLFTPTLAPPVSKADCDVPVDGRFIILPSQ